MQRSALFVLLVLLLCTGCSSTGGNGTVPAPEEKRNSILDLGLRFDGYYREVRGEVRYLIRFFPTGRAVLVNGTKDLEAELPKFLQPQTQGNPAMGLYNVPVEIRGDSMFFMTRPEKGEISYRGKVMNASTVRFHRYSHINGGSQDMEYIFYPDSTALSAQ